MFAIRLLLPGLRGLCGYGIWVMRDTLEHKRPLKTRVAVKRWNMGSHVLHEVITECPEGGIWRGSEDARGT